MPEKTKTEEAPKPEPRVRITLSAEFSKRVRSAVESSAPPGGKPFVPLGAVEEHLARITEEAADPVRFVARQVAAGLRASGLPIRDYGGDSDDAPTDVDGDAVLSAGREGAS